MPTGRQRVGRENVVKRSISMPPTMWSRVEEQAAGLKSVSSTIVGLVGLGLDCPKDVAEKVRKRHEKRWYGKETA